MFGKPTFGSTSSTFGTTSSSLFNSNKPLGFGTQQTTQPAQQTGTTLFGSKPGGLFGSATTQQTTANLFGSTSTQQQTGTSLFGQSKPSLFGASSTQGTSSGFGTGSSSGLFGSPSAGTSTGLFGATTQPAPNGTSVKFEPPIASDTMIKNNQTQSINTKHMCITAMKAYEAKSLEELRVDDYLANRKIGTATSAFGSTTAGTAGGGLFGQSSTGTTSVFGQTQNKPLFGGSSTSAFGSPQQQQTTPFVGSTGLFGSSTAATGGGLFGAKPATQQSAFSFNTATSSTTPAFGTTTGTTGGGLFGGTQNKPLFGGSSTSAFGSPQQQQTTPFVGSNVASTGTGSTGLFGSSTAATGGGLFGAKPATQQSAFSFNTATSSATPAFGTTTGTTGGGLFGSTQNKPLFGGGSTTTGLFGQPAAQTTAFGAQPGITGGLFGNTAQTTTQPTFGAAPTPMQSVAPAPGVVISLSDIAAQKVIEQTYLETQVKTSPYATAIMTLRPQTPGGRPVVPSPVPAEGAPDSSATVTSAQRRFLRSAVVSSPAVSANTTSATPNITTTPSTGLSPPSVSTPPVAGTKVLDTSKGASRLRGTAEIAQDLNYSRSVAPPTLGRGLRQGPPAMMNSPLHNNSTTASGGRAIDQLFDTSSLGQTNVSRSNVLGATASAQKRGSVKHLDMNIVNESLDKSGRTVLGGRDRDRDPDELPSRSREVLPSTINNQAVSPTENPLEAARTREHLRQRPPPQLNLDASVDSTMSSLVQHEDEDRENRRFAASAIASSVSNNTPAPSRRPEPAGLKLIAPDYYTDPPLAAMEDLVEDDGYVHLQRGLTIGRSTFGSVFWPGPIKLKDLVIDDTVVFRHKEVTVYPDEKKKPPEGQGLNRPAEVTLERVWPLDKATKEPIKDPLKLVEMGWRERLERACARQQAVFKDYRPHTGSWCFKVEHFSKYGLPDGDEDDEMMDEELQKSRHDAEIQSLVQREPLALLPPNIAHPHQEAHGLRVAAEARLVTLEELIVEPLEPQRENELRGSRGLGGDLADESPELFMARMTRMTAALIEDDEDDEMDGLGCRIPDKRMKMEVEDDADYYQKTLQLVDAVEARAGHPHQNKKPLVLHCERSRELWSHLPPKSFPRADTSVIDVARGHGNATRVGWAPGSIYTRSLQPTSFKVAIHQFENPDNLNEAYLVDLFDANIRLSQRAARDVNAWRFAAKTGLALVPRTKPATKSHAELLDAFVTTARQHDELGEQRVWSLCQALFTDQLYEDGSPRGLEDLLGEWLRDAVSILPEDDKTSKKEADAVLRAIARGDLEAATKAAQEAGLERLALALTVFPVDGDERTARQYFQSQVDLWVTNQMPRVDEALVKVCLLMARQTHAQRQHKGRIETVNALEGLDWMQALGVLIWWHGHSLHKALDMIKVEEREGRLVVRENAPWTGDTVEAELIRLAADRAHHIEKVLDAATRWCDYSLSWHLWTVLRAVGYSHMDAAREHALHLAYADQLASLDFPLLALFTLAHIANDDGRASAMHSMLEREGAGIEDEELARMVDICAVPHTWIAAAKLAKIPMDEYVVCALALEAEDYETALRVFVEQLAPNAVILEQFDVLQRFGEAFTTVADKIPGWGAQGQIFVDYVELKTLVAADVETEEDGDERFKDLIHALKTRVHANEFTAPLQKLAIQSIATQLYELELQTTGKKDFSLPLTVQQIGALELKMQRVPAEGV